MKRFFSLIALVGVLAACQPEELETSFEKANAVATINVTTVDIQSGNPVTTATITADKGAVSGQTVTLEGNPAITKQVVKVTAKYNNKEYSENVSVNALLAGGIANYNVIIVVGEAISDYTFSAVSNTPVDDVQTAYLTQATISHSGKMWIENNTEFMLTGTVTYSIYSGATAVANVTNENFKAVVDSYKDAYDLGITTTPGELPITVSAYAYYTAYMTRTITTTVYTIKATKDGVSQNVGTVTVEAASSTVAQYEEMADPNAHGVYHHGHGHDSHDGHGTGSNAGGGIIFAD